MAMIWNGSLTSVMVPDHAVRSMVWFPAPTLVMSGMESGCALWTLLRLGIMMVFSRAGSPSG